MGTIRPVRILLFNIFCDPTLGCKSYLRSYCNVGTFSGKYALLVIDVSKKSSDAVNHSLPIPGVPSTRFYF